LKSKEDWREGAAQQEFIRFDGSCDRDLRELTSGPLTCGSLSPSKKK